MVLSLDSLGQCVSALSKRFAAAESIRDTVKCLPHNHHDKHSEVRHRKDHQQQQEEDTAKSKVEITIPQLVCIQLVCQRLTPPGIVFVSPIGNIWQGPHFHFKKAKPQLWVRHRAYQQTKRRAESSIQGARDHSTW